MILHNVSFGIYAFLPQGWIFMILIVLLEFFILSKLLTKYWISKKVLGSTIVANVVSGLVGGLLSLLVNGGWWLIVWIPWVSKNEVSNSEVGKLITVYIFAYALTVVLEAIVNYFILKTFFKWKAIIAHTIIANSASYLFGSVIFYSISFT